MLAIEFDNEELTMKTFQNLMGNDVEARRTFIENNAEFVVNLDI